MHTNRRLFVLSLCAAGVTHPSIAQTSYPNKPIKMIVPFAPGGGTDLVARALCTKLSELLGQPIVIDNRGGGGGTIGAEALVRSPADGYTLTFGAASYATNAAVYKLPYDPVADVTPISLVGQTGYAVVAHPKVPVSNLSELLAYAKANPGVLNYGSSGAGGLSHLAMVLLDRMAGTRMVHVPYKGTGPDLADLLGGQTQLMLGSLPTVVPYVKSGRLKALAVTTAKRVPALPDLPAIQETVPGYEAALWYGVWGPKNLPAEVVKTLNDAVNRLLGDPQVQAAFAREALETIGGPPERLTAVLKKDIQTWMQIAREANVRNE